MKRIILKTFLGLPENERQIYYAVLTHLKPKEVYKIQADSLTYNEVKLIYKELQSKKPNIEYIFCTCLKINTKTFLNIKIDIFFQQKAFIEKYFITLYTNELKLLSSAGVDVEKWRMAGGDKLNKYSDVLALSQLAKMYGGYPFDWGSKPYKEIIYLLTINKVQGEVEYNYQKQKK